MVDFALRPPESADVPFLYNSWLKSYRDSPTVAGIPNTLYYTGQHALIERLLRDCEVVIACSKEDPGQILGYGIGETGLGTATVHWIYVKHPFRGFGIGRALYQDLVGDQANVYFTHRPKNGERLLRGRPVTYNPYLLMSSK